MVEAGELLVQAVRVVKMQPEVVALLELLELRVKELMGLAVVVVQAEQVVQMEWV